MKKGRHRRFEEARALKQAFDLGLTPGSTIMEAPFDPETDEFGVRFVGKPDFSDLQLVLWLDDAPDQKCREAIAEAVDDWYDDATTGTGGVLNDLQDRESGQSTDGRHFMAWWVDMGTLDKSAITGLVERFQALADDGQPLATLEIGGTVPV